MYARSPTIGQRSAARQEATNANANSKIVMIWSGRYLVCSIDSECRLLANDGYAVKKRSKGGKARHALSQDRRPNSQAPFSEGRQSVGQPEETTFDSCPGASARESRLPENAPQVSVAVFLQVEALGDGIEVLRDVVRTGKAMWCRADVYASRAQGLVDLLELCGGVIRMKVLHELMA